MSRRQTRSQTYNKDHYTPQRTDQSDEDVQDSSDDDDDEQLQPSGNKSISSDDSPLTAMSRSDLNYSGNWSGSSVSNRKTKAAPSSSDGNLTSEGESWTSPNFRNIDHGGGGEGYTNQSPNAWNEKGRSPQPDSRKLNAKMSESRRDSPEMSDIKSGSNSSRNFPFEILVLSIVIFSLVFVMTGCHEGLINMFGSHKGSPVNKETSFDRFLSSMTNLEKNFPNQNRRLWKTVKASTIHVLNETESLYPVVILMGTSQHNARLSRCLARKITSGFESAQELDPGESAADVAELVGLDSAEQKERLDEMLQAAFSKGKKSFIIDNFQQLHPEAALLLHGYCDNDNAPHKDIMMVLVLHMDEKDVSDVTSSSVESHLDQLWSRGLETDKVKALLSRVANNIVTVEREDDVNFRNACT